MLASLWLTISSRVEAMLIPENCRHNICTCRNILAFPQFSRTVRTSRLHAKVLDLHTVATPVVLQLWYFSLPQKFWPCILLSIDVFVLSFSGHSLSSSAVLAFGQLFETAMAVSKIHHVTSGWKTGRNLWMQHLNAWWATTEMKWCLQIHTSEWKSKRHGLSLQASPRLSDQTCSVSDAFKTVKHIDHICLLAFWTHSCIVFKQTEIANCLHDILVVMCTAFARLTCLPG